MNNNDLFFLEKKANDIRISIVKMLIEAGTGHTAGPLGMADIFTYLFLKGLKHKPKQPFWENRDRLVLSNGHICPVLYAAMSEAGYFEKEELLTLRKFGSRLQGHPHREFLPGLETSSGPLGSGLSQSVGMALAERIDNPNSSKMFYCLLGDGELNCGQNWEALMQAGKEKLDNIIAIIDRNGIQIDGDTQDIMPLEPLVDKFESFNWNVLDINGHDFESIEAAINEGKEKQYKPTMIIAHTIPGKGIPEISGDYRWHGSPPGKGPEDVWKKSDQGKKFLEQLKIKEDAILKKYK